MYIYRYHHRVLSRERNRLHAKKTRERKKVQSNALQARIEELREEVSLIYIIRVNNKK